MYCFSRQRLPPCLQDRSTLVFNSEDSDHFYKLRDFGGLQGLSFITSTQMAPFQVSESYTFLLRTLNLGWQTCHV